MSELLLTRVWSVWIPSALNRTDDTMTLPIRIENDETQVLPQDAPSKRYNGKLTECDTSKGKQTVKRKTTLHPRGVMRS